MCSQTSLILVTIHTLNAKLSHLECFEKKSVLWHTTGLLLMKSVLPVVVISQNSCLFLSMSPWSSYKKMYILLIRSLVTYILIIVLITSWFTSYYMKLKHKLKKIQHPWRESIPWGSCLRAYWRATWLQSGGQLFPLSTKTSSNTNLASMICLPDTDLNTDNPPDNKIKSSVGFSWRALWFWREGLLLFSLSLEIFF